MTTLTDDDILALNSQERFFSESPTKYPEAGHGTQYHCGRPGLIGFARAVEAEVRAALAPPLAAEPAAYVNGDELDNMLDDRAVEIQGQPSSWRRTPLYRAAQAQEGGA